MSDKETISTEEALQKIDVMLSRFDLDSLDQLPDQERQELALRFQKISERLEALATSLESEFRARSEKEPGHP